MLMSFNEYYLSNMGVNRELPAWIKLEKYYNCEDFLGRSRLFSKKIKKNKNKL